MDFKVDENLPEDVVQLLRDNGHGALSVYQERLSGRPDPDVVERARTESRALITLDLDFADIRTYPPANFPGLIVLRLRRQDRAAVIAAVKSMLPLLGKEALRAQLWIVTEANVRIHGELEAGEADRE